MKFFVMFYTGGEEGRLLVVSSFRISTGER